MGSEMCIRDRNNNLLHNAANMALNMINEYDKFSDNKSIRGL